DTEKRHTWDPNAQNAGMMIYGPEDLISRGTITPQPGDPGYIDDPIVWSEEAGALVDVLRNEAIDTWEDIKKLGVDAYRPIGATVDFLTDPEAMRREWEAFKDNPIGYTDDKLTEVLPQVVPYVFQVLGDVANIALVSGAEDVSLVWLERLVQVTNEGRDWGIRTMQKGMNGEDLNGMESFYYNLMVGLSDAETDGVGSWPLIGPVARTVMDLLAPID